MQEIKLKPLVRIHRKLDNRLLRVPLLELVADNQSR